MPTGAFTGRLVQRRASRGPDRLRNVRTPRLGQASQSLGLTGSCLQSLRERFECLHFFVAEGRRQSRLVVVQICSGPLRRSERSLI